MVIPAPRSPADCHGGGQGVPAAAIRECPARMSGTLRASLLSLGYQQFKGVAWCTGHSETAHILAEMMWDRWRERLGDEGDPPPSPCGPFEDLLEESPSV